MRLAAVFSLLLMLFLAHVATSRPVHVVQTSKTTGDRLATLAPLELTRELAHKGGFSAQNDVEKKKAVTVAINRATSFQKILGFGGAFTEATAYVISQLKPELQDEIVQAYFGPNGQQYSIGRLHINSCDFSVQSYSYCDSVDDFDLVNFTIEGTPDTKFIFPLLRTALSTTSQDFLLFASPWSPPAWMKQNENMVGSSFPRGLKRGVRYERSWALYFSKYISALKQQGFNLWAVTLQNEPMAPHFEIIPGAWEACYFLPRLQRDFLRDHLGPRLASDHPEVKIIVHDSQKPNLVHDSEVLMSDPEAAKYISGFGVHWYTGGEAFDALRKTAEKYPDRFIMGTEACEGFLPSEQGPILGSWERGEHYAHDILNDLESYAVAWMDWNMVLDQTGGPNHVGNLCDAPIIADINTQVLHYQLPYYYMGHFTRFLPRDSVRLAHTSTDEDLETTVFVTPANQTVVIALNRNDVEFPLTVVDGGESFSDVVPARSIKTYVY